MLKADPWQLAIIPIAVSTCTFYRGLLMLFTESLPHSIYQFMPELIPFFAKLCTTYPPADFSTRSQTDLTDLSCSLIFLYIFYEFWKFRHILEELRNIPAYSVKFQDIPQNTGKFRYIPAFQIFTTPCREPSIIAETLSPTASHNIVTVKLTRAPK